MTRRKLPPPPLNDSDAERYSAEWLSRRLAELRSEPHRLDACSECGCGPGRRCPVGNDRVIAACFIAPWAEDRRCTACRGESPRMTWEEVREWGEERAA